MTQDNVLNKLRFRESDPRRSVKYLKMSLRFLQIKTCDELERIFITSFSKEGFSTLDAFYRESDLLTTHSRPGPLRR